MMVSVEEIATGDSVGAAVRRTVDRLVCVHDGIPTHAMATSSGRPKLQTSLQVAFRCLPTQEIDRVVYETVMSHAAAAERLGPGCLGRFFASLQRQLGNTNTLSTRYSVRHLCVASKVASSADVSRLLEQELSAVSSVTKAMAMQALELAGFGGRVIVEKTHASRPSVELVRGYTFELEQLLPIDANMLRPRVFCIDGHVEEVSEVHHLLEAAAEAKEPCIVFLRGMSDDVKHTLRVNYDRGSLKVLPMRVRLDLEGMNTLVDLATVTGANLVSSLKGDLISSMAYVAAPVVDRVTAYKGKVVIQHDGTKQRVEQHASALRGRRETEPDEGKGRLLDRRIKSLSPNHTIIRLPDDKDFVVNSQAIDRVLRTIRSLVDHGVAESGSLQSAELAAEAYAERCAHTLGSLGAVILQES